MNTEHVVKSYSDYREEDRFSTDNARKVEFLTSIRAVEENINPQANILDPAAGTGAYAFYLNDKGHSVTALDITPRHIELINENKGNRDIKAFVNDARDLSMFEDNSFDAVLCMGPLYHLTELSDRKKCLNECKRVLKTGGLLISAYINRFFVIPQIVLQDRKFIDADIIKQLRESGSMRSDDEFCFWTDTYFAAPEDMESIYSEMGLNIVDHIAADGVSIFIKNTINAMNADEFKIWCDYHYSTCREKSMLGISNHGLVFGRK